MTAPPQAPARAIPALALPDCSGHCARCGREHSLPGEPARQACRELMDALDREHRIDLLTTEREADPRLSTEVLFGPARGQMFGAMVFRAPDGSLGTARAFSGQFNGVWDVPGWVPPLIGQGEFLAATRDTEREIKRIGARLAVLPSDDPGAGELRRTRAAMSRALMQDIHGLYRLKNFRGGEIPLTRAFLGPGGPPSGTGDCCAPKLLQYAAMNGLTPLGLAEFFWGAENRSKTRRHGEFFAPCAAKCRPILGFMLCGLEAKRISRAPGQRAESPTKQSA